MTASTAQDPSTGTAWCEVRETTDRLLVRWGAGDTDLWQELKRDWRSTFPRHADAVYGPKERAWSVPARLRVRVQQWVNSWFEAEAITWVAESAWSDAQRTARGQRGPRRQRRSRQSEETPHGRQLPGTRGERADTAVRRAYRLLHLRCDAPDWAVDAMYRACCKRHHPDVAGPGSHEHMVGLARAVQLIRQHQGRRALAQTQAWDEEESEEP